MTRGFIVHPTYRVQNRTPVLQFFGRLESGEPFLVEEDRFRPYFFVHQGHEGLLQGEVAQVEQSPYSDLSGRPLSRVTTSLPGEVPELRERLEGRGAAVFEADLRFPYRFLMDRQIRTGVRITGRGRVRAGGLVMFQNPQLEAAKVHAPLRTLSIDLETTPDASRVISAALVQGDHSEVHLLGRRSVAGAVVHPEEPALLHAVNRRIRQLDPDLIVGWNVIEFDMAVWLARCKACRIPGLLGRDERKPARMLYPPQGARAAVRVEVTGRMVIDGLALTREALRLPDYRLETAARKLLGRSKKIDHAVKDTAAEIMRLWREDPEALVAYNREDARLALEILKKEGLLTLCEERSRLSGVQMDRVSASVFNFDLLYLPELRKRGAVAPCVNRGTRNEHVAGGALLDPVPGIHQRVAVLDFKSLYPSLICSFQLDPLAHARADREDDPIEAPGGARFAREGAVLPEIVERLMARREEAKALGDAHTNQAVKIMMNALFGVLGTPACRFFDPDVAGSITRFGRQILHWTRDAFEQAGVPVLYGDTDSVFVQLPEAPDAQALAAEAERLRCKVQRALDDRIRSRYRVQPRLELELERIFERFFLPRVRGGKSGSKKRYAGLCSGRLLVVGLESVRRDWPELATRLQEGVLTRLFTDKDPLPFINDLVERLHAGELDRELIYTKRIRKGSLDRYTVGAPHIQAARKAGAEAGDTIHYLVTHSGPEPMLPGDDMPRGIDYEHYIERVLRPVADSILREVGSSFGSAVGEASQPDLL